MPSTFKPTAEVLSMLAMKMPIDRIVRPNAGEANAPYQILSLHVTRLRYQAGICYLHRRLITKHLAFLGTEEAAQIFTAHFV